MTWYSVRRPVDASQLLCLDSQFIKSRDPWFLDAVDFEPAGVCDDSKTVLTKTVFPISATSASRVYHACLRATPSTVGQCADIEFGRIPPEFRIVPSAIVDR